MIAVRMRGRREADNGGANFEWGKYLGLAAQSSRCNDNGQHIMREFT
jgi:hypothetical protein